MGAPEHSGLLLMNLGVFSFFSQLVVEEWPILRSSGNLLLNMPSISKKKNWKVAALMASGKEAHGAQKTSLKRFTNPGDHEHREFSVLRAGKLLTD